MEVAAKQATPVPTRNSGLGMTMHGKVIVELRRLALGCPPEHYPRAPRETQAVDDCRGRGAADVRVKLATTSALPAFSPLAWRFQFPFNR